MWTTVVLAVTGFIIRQVNIYPLGYHLPFCVCHRLQTNVLVMLSVCCWDNHYPHYVWDSEVYPNVSPVWCKLPIRHIRDELMFSADD